MQLVVVCNRSWRHTLSISNALHYRALYSRLGGPLGFLPTPIKNQDNIYKNFNHEIRQVINLSTMAADAVFVHVETPLPWGLDTTFLLLFRGVYLCRTIFLLFLTPLILDFSDKHTLPCCSFMLKIRYLVYTKKSPNLQEYKYYYYFIIIIIYIILYTYTHYTHIRYIINNKTIYQIKRLKTQVQG